MTGLDDLRRTLESHADVVAHDDTARRRASVHERIGVARRRRRAAAVGGVAVVAAAVAFGVVLPGGETTAPAPPAVDVGVDPPPTLDSGGFRFRLAETVEGQDGRAEVDLDADRRPRLVSWATSGPDDEVVISPPGNPTVWRSADFDNFVLVREGEAERIVVEATSGEPTLAVYELPPGTVTGLDVMTDGPVENGLTAPQLLPDEYQLGGQVWARFDTATQEETYDALVARVPEGRDDVLVLSSVDATKSGPWGVTVREDYGGLASDGGKIELSQGSATGAQGGFVRQPGDEVSLTVELGGAATLAFGFYERVR